MNVYSLRLIPSIKLKFCEILGIASTMAISELQNRVERLEVVLNRMDQRTRRANRPHIFYQEAPPKAVKAKKKIAAKKITPKNKPAKVLESVTTPKAPVLTQEITVEPVAPVLLIQVDPETREAVAQYFGTEVPCLEAVGVTEALDRLSGSAPQAVFFDRLLLGEEESRAALQKLALDYPEAKLVGLSSYLTLAFSQSMPAGASNFATFLTKPLQRQNLSEIFGALKQEAI